MRSVIAKRRVSSMPAKKKLPIRHRGGTMSFRNEYEQAKYEHLVEKDVKSTIGKEVRLLKECLHLYPNSEKLSNALGRAENELTNAGHRVYASGRRLSYWKELLFLEMTR